MLLYYIMKWIFNRSLVMGTNKKLNVAPTHMGQGRLCLGEWPGLAPRLALLGLMERVGAQAGFASG